jgi:hypothetical protein
MVIAHQESTAISLEISPLVCVEFWKRPAPEKVVPEGRTSALDSGSSALNE